MTIKPPAFVDVLSQIDGMTFLTTHKLLQLYQWCLYASHLDGVAIEVGVCKGGSLKMIASVLQNKSVFGFDTFEGLPAEQLSKNDSEYIRSFISKNDCAMKSEIEDVQERLFDCKNVSLQKGLFPRDFQLNQPCCFAHVDVDLYVCMKETLETIIPMMVTYGVIIVDDYTYPTLPGVQVAVDEVLSEHNNLAFVMSAKYQVVLIKLPIEVTHTSTICADDMRNFY